MKNIFGAKAQTGLFVKGMALLMLVFFLTLSVTSCKNETAAAVTPTTEVESVLEKKPTAVPAPVEENKQLQELGTDTEVDYRSLCIGGGSAGQASRLHEIGGNGAIGTVPRILTYIGGTTGQVSRYVAIGGQEFGQSRKVCIGGNQTAQRLVDIGGNGAGSTVPRRLPSSKLVGTILV